MTSTGAWHLSGFVRLLWKRPIHYEYGHQYETRTLKCMSHNFLTKEEGEGMGLVGETSATTLEKTQPTKLFQINRGRTEPTELYFIVPVLRAVIHTRSLTILQPLKSYTSAPTFREWITSRLGMYVSWGLCWHAGPLSLK